MAGFIITIIIIAICILFFGKADSKKEILNQIGLDFSKNKYEDKKENEYKKYSIQAMKKVIDLNNNYICDENSLLAFLSDKLDLAINPRYSDDPWSNSRETLNLGVKPHYIEHAYTVVYRRKNDIQKGNDTPLRKNVLFSDKKEAKKYCELLWDKYQYPWPKDWMQKDGL